MDEATFAIALDANMQNLDKVFEELEKGKWPIGSRSRQPFKQGFALIISQDGHNDVFAVVGCLRGMTLHEKEVQFKSVERFPIPVVIQQGEILTSRRVLGGKSICNPFMYLTPEAEHLVCTEADRLRKPQLG
jgi:hypothetical protein